LRLVVEDADKEDLDVLRKLDGTQDWRTAKLGELHRPFCLQG
jgi:hypothetical protein